MAPLRDLDWLDLLKGIQKPGRYTGGEWNSIRKDPSKVKARIALIFPDLYEIGMSYLGQKILYADINAHPDYAAERVYAPWPDFEARLRERNRPLCSLENQTPLSTFDILGFSLLYELNYSNVLTEVYEGVKKVYMPTFGFEQLDKAAARAYEKAGFQVVYIKGLLNNGLTSWFDGAGLDCLTSDIRIPVQWVGKSN